MIRAGSSARAKARQLRRQELRNSTRTMAVATLGGGLLGLVDNPGASVPAAGLGALGGAFWLAYRGRRSGERPASARWKQGADGERRTALAVKSLKRDGWRLFDDLSIPGSKANLDHVWVAPSGRVVVVGDTKAWHSPKALVQVDRGGVLRYGPWRQDQTVNTMRWEADHVRTALGDSAHVVSILVIDGGKVDRNRYPSGWIRIDDAFYVVEQAKLRDTLAGIAGTPNLFAARRLANAINQRFPRYK